LLHNPTGGDITPDGKTIMIQNEPFMLIWEREMADGQYESVGTTLARMPKQVTAYKKEPQGEAIAWLDNTTCYTTSDVYSDGSAPIWKYTRTLESAE
jgi:hypothetical protein